MFRTKRSDATVRSIESTYGIDLNARDDMHLGNLLNERGFDSQTQLIAAYHRRLAYHARKRRVFLSFHAEDLPQVRGFRLMAATPNIALGFHDGSVREAVDSDSSSYIRGIIKGKIRQSSVLVCLIGNGTAWRDWVDWELQTAYEMRKGVCGVRMKGSRGRTPKILLEMNAPIADWDLTSIVKVIECAAARRS